MGEREGWTLGLHCPVKVAASQPVGPHRMVAVPPASQMAEHSWLKGILSLQSAGQTPLPSSRFGGGPPGQILGAAGAQGRRHVCTGRTAEPAASQIELRVILSGRLLLL